jgi:prolipoprotein diacylglyceryltransferase
VGGVGLVGAGLWAQLVEGSAKLSRPYGFYGGLLGTSLGAVFLAPALGVPAWTMLGAVCVAGPWVQALGRLRCLVQGCCHGAPAPDAVAIRYTHPRSRVCRLSDLGGVAVHPTPLYSILSCVALGAVTLHLWWARAPLCLVGGVYLIAMGLGRFVEEAYRGEPPTPVYARRRRYQWTSIVTVAIGAVVTSLGGRAPAPPIDLHAGALYPALFFGLACGVALGVDFPESKARFSRLA